MSRRTTSAISRRQRIVRDAECIREVLSQGALEPARPEFRRLCSLTYLSLFPRSLHEVYLTGDVAPSGAVRMRSTGAIYQRVADKNRAFFAPLPGPGLANRLANHLHHYDVRLPNGQHLTVEQLRQQGLDSASGILRHFYCPAGRRLHRRTPQPAPSSARLQAMQPFSTNRCSPSCTSSHLAKGAPATGRQSG